MLRQIIILVLFTAFSISSIYAEDSCESPTDTIVLGSTLNSQEIDRPYIDGEDGESLYYKIVLSSDGRLVINSAVDSANSSDTVNTYGSLLNSDCSTLDDNDVEINSSPRYFKFDKELVAGTYFLKVYNDISLDDSNTDLAKGFFQLENSFTTSRKVSITKTNQTTIDSGDEIVYTYTVTNEGTEDTANTIVKDPLPNPNHLTYVGIDSSTTGWSCEEGDPVECKIDGGVLSAGDSKTLKLIYKADYQTYDRTVSNTSSIYVLYSDETVIEENATQSSVAINKAIPGIKITVDAPDSVVQYDEFNYRFTVENNGTKITDTNVTVTGSITSDFDIVDIIYDSSIWKNCTYDAEQSYTCELIDDLPQDASKYFEIKVQAIGDPEDEESVVSGPVVNSDTVMGHIDDSDSKKVTILAKDASVEVTMKGSSDNVVIGHSAYFTVDIKNSGNIELTDLQITDLVPSELDLTNVTSDDWDCSSTDIDANYVDCTLSSLAKGVTKQIFIYVDGKTVANDIVNTLDIFTAEGAVSEGNETINIIEPTDGIRIKKSASSTTVYGLDTFEYIIGVDNNGSESDSNIVVKDSIDSSLTLTSDWNSNTEPWSCSNSGNDITCNYSGTLDSESSTPDIKIKVQAPYTTSTITIDNNAVVTADSGSSSTSVTDNDSATVTVNPTVIGFGMTKTSSKSSVKSGETYTYTITVSNDGTLQEQNVTVIDTIPEILDGNFTLNARNFDCSETSGRDINCILSTLEAGDSDYFTIDITAPIVTESTVVVNDANSTAKIYIPSTVDETLTDNSSVSVTINPADSSLSITNTSSKDLILEGDIFYYIIDVTNNSIADEYNLTVTDDIPSDLTIQSINASGWSCSDSSNNITCTLDTLAAGENSGDINITVKAPDTISENKTITNQTTVTSSKDSVGKSAQKDVTLISPDNAISIVMTSNPSSVYADDIYYYKITVSNNSEEDIESLELNDTLPTELTYDHFTVDGGWSCDYNDTTRVFKCDNNENLFSNGEKVIELYVKAPSYESNITNSVNMVSSLDEQDRNATVVTTVDGKTAKLIYTVSKSDKDTVGVGEDFIYSIKVKNDGTAPDSDVNATNVKITFNLDENISYQSFSTSDWNCSFDSQVLTCDLPILELSKESSEINVTVQGNVEKLTTSTAHLLADQTSTSEDVSINVNVLEIVDIDMGLQLSDSIENVEADSIYYYNLIISNYDSLKDAKNIIVDINTTSSDDYTLNSYSDTTDWECSKSDTLLRCQLKHDLLADSNETLTLEVQAPNSVTTVEVDAILYSEYVNDTDMANNSVSEETNIVVTDLTASTPREFTKVPLQGMVDMNIFGDLITIGNQSICEKDSSGNCQEPTYYVNDLVTQEYVNLDSTYASSYKTATSARLEIEDSDEIVWAGLYWMGRIDKTISGYQTKMEDAHKVYLRADANSSGYVEVQALRSTDAIDNNGTTITVDKFNFINSDDYFDYQGVADVTSYVKANRGGDYWVADIQSSEGDNMSAGWNMVVIVRDTKVEPTRELKNITIFDGFQGVWKSPDYMTDDYPDEVNQTVSGFLTPTTGPIKSSLIFFGFEGDRTLSDFVKVSDSTGYMYALSNAKNPEDDAINGTITKNGVTVTTRAPNLDNTSGIDVDEFYLGDINDTMGTGIIDNGQTSANISIGSLGMVSNGGGGDRFFLGMFGFSTNLNDPVCYMQTLKNADFTADLGSSVQLGDTIGIEVEFHNKEIQTLTNMHGYSQIDKVFREDNSTFELKNIDESAYTAQDSLFSFGTVDVGDDNLTEVTTSIGYGATSSVGGDIQTGESVYIRFNAIIDDITDDNLTNNVYSVSYDPNPDKKIQVSRCSGNDQTLEVLQNSTNGFEITHVGGLTDGVNDGLNDGDETDPSNENHLFTQVVNQDFNIDIIALDDSNGTKTRSGSGSDNYKGVLEVEVVKYDQSIVDTFTNPCGNFVSISEPSYLPIDDDIRQSITLNVPTATKYAAIRVRYLINKYGKHAQWSTATNNMSELQNVQSNNSYDDDRCKDVCIDTPNEDSCRSCLYKDVDNGGLSKPSCSTDVFAIRPAKIDLDINSTTLVGGRSYDLILDANSTGYDQNISQNTNGSLEYNLTNPGGCSSVLNGSMLLTGQTIEFISGEANLSNFQYSNIGDINVTIVDNSWTQYDQNLTDENMSDCIVGSSSIVPNSDNKVGCNIEGKKEFSFAPARFKSDFVSLSDFSNGFTYMSNDSSMGAPFLFTITALLDDNSTATNFSSSCYASDVNYTVSLTGSSLISAGVPRFFDLSNSITSNSLTGEFNTTEGNFTNGAVTVGIGLNAQRDVTIAKEPFIINSQDLAVSVESQTYSTTGSGLFSVVDTNATFYYGRLHVPDIETALTDINVTFYYEIYCKNCDRSIFNLADSSESVDSINWSICNASHTSALQGTYSGLDSENGMTFANITFSGATISLGTNSAPHSDKITFVPSPWLIYNKFNSSAQKDSFNINIVSTAQNWSGKGEIGMTIDGNLSERSTKKLEW